MPSDASIGDSISRRAPGPASGPRRAVGVVAARASAAALGVATVAGGLVVRGFGRPPRPPDRYRKIFVVGCPRSGTTWVADILGRHPEVIRGRESQLYSTIRQSLGAYGAFNPIGWARLFYAVQRGVRIDAKAGIHLYIDTSTLVRVGTNVLGRAPSADAVAPRLVRGVLDAFFARNGGSAARVLVEKTPAHLFYIDDILTEFPEAQVVVVVRDGRDVCVSMALRAARVSAFPDTTEGRIRSWARAVEAGAAAANDPRLRDRILTVHYEDLKAQPSEQIARLLSAVHLPSEDELIREIAALSDIARFNTGPGEFRHRGEVGTWTEHFSSADEATFRALAGDAFALAGYSFDEPDGR